MKRNNLYIEKLKKESQEIRDILVEVTSKNGGHLASNLGVVELTQAIIEIFNIPEDKLLFDVGHQSYVYKLLTDRKDKFTTLRKKNGVGPFLDPEESKYDFFLSGHAGSALSAGIGIAKANPNSKVIVVVGDASIANGHSLEALNSVGNDLKNIIVILNANNMSIGENVGSLSKFFGRVMISRAYMTVRREIRELISRGKVGNKIKEILERAEYSVKQFFVPSSISEIFGYKFLGVVDGHNLESLLHILTKAKNMVGPVFVHVKTEKGKGYHLAEKNKEKFHGISPFDPSTGEIDEGGNTYSNVFGKKIVEIGEKDKNIYAISAAMLKGTGLGEFYEKFQNRCIDVGIAEGHGVTMAAGLAISSKKPYVAMYSTFFQRAFDQLIHDVGLQNLPVRFIIDRAGIVGEDGKTHQGVHDINMFLTMPNFRVIAPTTGKELEKVLEFSKNFEDGPLAIRFPRGKAFELESVNFNERQFEIGKWTEIKKGKDNLYLATGAMLEEILNIDEELKEKGIDGTIVACASINPLDEKFILNEFSKYQNIFTLEDGYRRGGFGDEVLRFINSKKIQINLNVIALDTPCIAHGTRMELLEENGLRGKKLMRRIEGNINGKK